MNQEPHLTNEHLNNLFPSPFALLSRCFRLAHELVGTPGFEPSPAAHYNQAEYVLAQVARPFDASREGQGVKLG